MREQSELIDTQIFTLEEVESYIANGQPIDGMLTQALYFWKSRFSSLNPSKD